MSDVYSTDYVTAQDGDTAIPDSGFNWSGLLGKAVDTALDVVSARQGSKSTNVPVSVYPTGSTSPEVVAAQKQSPSLQATSGNNALIIGGAVLAGVVVLALILKKS